MSKKGFSTTCLHTFEFNRKNDSHILPIVPSSSFTFDSLDDGMAIFKKEKAGHTYSRYGNPTVEAVAAKIAELESFNLAHNAWAYMTSSGMSAIYVLLNTLLSPGDAIITPIKLYGGTTELFDSILAGKGIRIIKTDMESIETIRYTLNNTSNVKAVYLETPSNPTLSCTDLAAVATAAKEAGIHTIADNTFCTPFLQNPLDFGVDFVIHSTTKYLNGHGNSIAGIIIGNTDKTLQTAVWKNLKLIGAICSPFEAWLTYNGLKTLELRMIRHCDNALQLAKFLKSHPNVDHVNYPRLESHPQYELCLKQMKNGGGGMLSFTVKGGITFAMKVMDKLKIATHAPTLGDVDTLVLHPASSSHLNVDKEQREREGVSDGLIRVSVGIENVADLIEDFNNALSLI